MSRRKKILRWSIRGVVMFLALVLGFLILLPHFINSEGIKTKILAAVSQKLNGTVECERVELSYFPRPHMTMVQASLNVPYKVNGTFRLVTFYPKILPLISGILIPSRVLIKRQNLRANLAHASEMAEPNLDDLTPLFTAMFPKIPDMLIEIRDGNVGFSQKDQMVFSFGNINSRFGFSSSGIELEVRCDSNLWETFILEGRVGSDRSRGEGRIKVSGFRAEALVHHLYPKAIEFLGETSVDLNVNYTINGLTEFQCEVEGSIPRMTLTRGDEKSVIQCQSFRAAFGIDQKTMTLMLTKLDLQHPSLQMKGSFLLDRASHETSVELYGNEVDVNSTREAALLLAGHIDAVKKLFEIVQGGKIPEIMLKSNGNSLHDLASLKKIKIEGRLLEGTIFVRKADTRLTDVNGDVVISHGILEGGNLEARILGAQGRQGKLKLGLQGDNAPLHLDVLVNADLEYLIPVLKRFVHNDAFLNEMSLIDQLKGRAQGRLVLGETLADIKPRVKVDRFNLSLTHRRLPFPITVSKGQFSYGGDGVRVTSLQSKVGKSSFSDLTAHLDWGETPFLEVDSVESLIFLDEIYPWLCSYQTLKRKLTTLKIVEGRLKLAEMNIKGPLLNPEVWRFKAEGKVIDLAIVTTLAPGSVNIVSGAFSATEKRLMFEDVHAKVLDSSVNISGTVDGYLQGVLTPELELNGEFGPEATKWLSGKIHLPPELRLRSPLSLRQGSLSWGEGPPVAFQGGFTAGEDADVSLDLVFTPGELEIKNLSIQDDESQAALILSLKKDELELDFTGNVTRQTLSKVVESDRFPSGWIQGDFRAHIFLSQPTKSTAHGNLIGGDLIFPWELKAPLRIHSIRLDADGQHIKTESTKLSYGDNDFRIQGEATVMEQGLALNLDLSTERIEWKDIEKIFIDGRGKREIGQGRAVGGLPIEGVLTIRADSFRYDPFTWSPIQADVLFGEEEISIQISEAVLCGISTPGTIKLTAQGLSLDFHLDSMAQPLEPTLECLLERKRQITGNFNLQGQLCGQGKKENLRETIHGSLQFSAENGRIYRHGLIAKIFAIMNVTEIFRGKLPDVTKEGFAYDSMTAKANIEQGKLNITEGFIDGKSAEIACEGFVDLIEQKLDLTFLIAPLKTVDAVVKKIPIVGDVLGGTLVSVPVKVTGSWNDPTITPLSPSAVGSGLLGIMKNAIKAPFKIIEPVVPAK